MVQMCHLSLLYSFVVPVHSLHTEMNQLTLDKDQFKKRQLFGGALTISIPSEWRDVSDVRQVPDNQEVYQDCTVNQGQENSLVGTGGCIIVEILERQNVSDEEAASFFFWDLAQANGGGSNAEKKKGLIYNKIFNVGISEGGEGDSVNDSNLMPVLTRKVKACTCIGKQSIGPLRGQAKTEKADKVQIELCAVRLASIETDLLITLTMPCCEKRQEDGKHDLSSLFRAMLKSFKVEDWTLFA